MFRRFFLLLLITLLPLQSIAGAFVTPCAGMAAVDAAVQQVLLSSDSSGEMNADMPCHAHSDDAALAGAQADQGCCQHMAPALLQVFLQTDASKVSPQIFPVQSVSFTDHLPDRLQRPPLALSL